MLINKELTKLGIYIDSMDNIIRLIVQFYKKEKERK